MRTMMGVHLALPDELYEPPTNPTLKAITAHPDYRGDCLLCVPARHAKLFENTNNITATSHMPCWAIPQWEEPPRQPSLLRSKP